VDGGSARTASWPPQLAIGGTGTGWTVWGEGETFSQKGEVVAEIGGAGIGCTGGSRSVRRLDPIPDTGYGPTFQSRVIHSRCTEQSSKLSRITYYAALCRRQTRTI
jgi:hypothetical protein